MHDSWEDCQKACIAIKECWFWTYYTEAVTDKSKYCELKHADDADADFNLAGAISGPKNCNGKLLFFSSFTYMVKDNLIQVGFEHNYNQQRKTKNIFKLI